MNFTDIDEVVGNFVSNNWVTTGSPSTSNTLYYNTTNMAEVKYRLQQIEKEKEEDKIMKKEDSTVKIEGSFDKVIIAPELINVILEGVKEAKEKLEKERQKGIPRPEDPIENVYFNFKKGYTTVKWKDGTITTVKCQKGDEFDQEKGLALCFMKKAYDNRGCFNEFLNNWMVDGVEQ